VVVGMVVGMLDDGRCVGAIVVGTDVLVGGGV
jgi:hypothetical protein